MVNMSEVVTVVGIAIVMIFAVRMAGRGIQMFLGAIFKDHKKKKD